MRSGENRVPIVVALCLTHDGERGPPWAAMSGTPAWLVAWRWERYVVGARPGYGVAMRCVGLGEDVEQAPGAPSGVVGSGLNTAARQRHSAQTRRQGEDGTARGKHSRHERPTHGGTSAPPVDRRCRVACYNGHGGRGPTRGGRLVPHEHTRAASPSSCCGSLDGRAPEAAAWSKQWTPSSAQHDPAWLRTSGLELAPVAAVAAQGGACWNRHSIGGCSAASSPPDACMATNHHCASAVQQKSTTERDSHRGFLAEGGDELPGRGRRALYRTAAATSPRGGGRGAEAHGHPEADASPLPPSSARARVVAVEGAAARRCQVAASTAACSTRHRGARVPTCASSTRQRRLGGFGGEVDNGSGREVGDFALLRVGPRRPAPRAWQGDAAVPPRHFSRSRRRASPYRPVVMVAAIQGAPPQRDPPRGASSPSAGSGAARLPTRLDRLLVPSPGTTAHSLTSPRASEPPTWRSRPRPARRYRPRGLLPKRTTRARGARRARRTRAGAAAQAHRDIAEWWPGRCNLGSRLPARAGGAVSSA